MLGKYVWLSSSLLFVMCSPEKKSGAPEPAAVTNTTIVKDVHSFARLDEVRTTALTLDIAIDFDRQVISGSATYDLGKDRTSDTLVLDTKHLDIKEVTLDNGQKTPFSLGQADPILGTALYIPLTPETQLVTVVYATTAQSEALQWLSPEQTAGKKHPYLFTQGEAILTRSWIPIQDTPGNRISYKAKVSLPPTLMAVMSASNVSEKNTTGVYEFTLDKAIPPYLIALAAGDLSFKPLGARTGVYSEPSVIEEYAYELADTEKMLEAAEELYGAYQWGRYDIIVLPPSFPFGGMENPMLTFATPTIIAGDRSLTALIAHELAHSWSGNLVTNATWDDFWLNEGFTVYFERRIMEKLYGTEYSDMLTHLSYHELLESVEGIMQQRPEDTRLKLELEGRNPDDGMTDIAYEKGCFFLMTLEKAAGRENFDRFLKEYFNTHQFQSITTDRFLAYLDKELIKKYNLQVDVNAWVHGQGLPAIDKPVSTRFDAVSAAIESWKSGADAGKLQTAEWSTHEWLHFLRNLPSPLSAAQLEELDKNFRFTQSGNSEILCAWLQIAIQNRYEKAYPKLEEFLTSVGRRKFLVPLYSTLVKTEEGKKRALDIYRKARPGYHFVSTQTIDKIVGWEGK